VRGGELEVRGASVQNGAKVAVLGAQSGVNTNISEQIWKQEGVGRQM
jgi:hypothetical protein